MVFKNKFFLDLGSDGEQQAPATIAPPTARPAAQPKAKAAAAESESRPAEAAATAEMPSQPVTSQTTAEAIAAQLAAEQASRPAPTLATFAPECVTAGGALSRSRRRGGADLGGFREMARGMLSS
ncbi:hypothetical protein [Synechococcus sp. CBW1004]|jgi:hypothetical protein|uniref:hypothetical protein n=1 Tax=Synechococcus sp. CBW1004 TaxID=1353136 RepID=UPI0018CCC180|nr:hypothetical protein [Synechococcus sp. CBW1004]QPN63705.1 hypothetical protein H8F25_02165 [Synechococcus sp. CBW1004]